MVEANAHYQVIVLGSRWLTFFGHVIFDGGEVLQDPPRGECRSREMGGAGGGPGDAWSEAERGGVQNGRMHQGHQP